MGHNIKEQKNKIKAKHNTIYYFPPGKLFYLY